MYWRQLYSENKTYAFQWLLCIRSTRIAGLIKHTYSMALRHIISIGFIGMEAN
jgi:hypothetical protein